MQPYLPEPQFDHGTPARAGILLVNLGTPDEPTAPAVRRYLREFLSDPRVVEIPRLVWWPILYGVILNTRPKKSAAKYAQIWTRDGSPLKVHTERLASLLRGYLGERVASPLTVAYAMRYGNPSLFAGLRQLREQRCERILVFPLYPQYAASTVGSAFDAVFDALRRYRNVPELRTIRHYHDHPAYIGALAHSVRAYWTKHGRPERLVMSFHGVPRYTLERGDPYHCECQKTGRLLAEALELAPEQYTISFQSRFGRARWLQPYTAATLEKLAKEGVGRVDVVCPGFPVDCLETLEEIAIEGKASFLRSGGREFHYIPCLNDSDPWVQAMREIALENLHGWVSPAWDKAAAERAAEATRLRARALGAAR